MPTTISTPPHASYHPTSIALVGESKTGKSYSLNTLKCSRVVFSLDPKGYESFRFTYHELAPGTLAVDGASILAQSNDADTNIVIDYTQAFSSISATATSAQAGFEAIWRKFVSDANAVSNMPAGAIALDGLTGISRLVLTTVCAMNKRTRPVFEGWGMTVAKVTEIIQSLVSMNKLFILMCHVSTDKDELTGRVKEQPLVYGKRLPDELLALFSNVFRTGHKLGKYLWYTRPQPLFQSIGSRLYDNMPEIIEQDFDALLTGAPKAISLRS